MPVDLDEPPVAAVKPSPVARRRGSHLACSLLLSTTMMWPVPASTATPVGWLN
jgi:hypothetical protein